MTGSQSADGGGPSGITALEEDGFRGDTRGVSSGGTGDSLPLPSKSTGHWSEQDLAVEVGIRPSIQCEGIAIVLSLVLPSWGLITSQLGFDNIWLYCRNEATWFRRSLKIAINDFDLSIFDTISISQASTRTFFIQGNEEFVVEMLLWLQSRVTEFDKVIFTCSLLGGPRCSAPLNRIRHVGPLPLSYTRVKHSHVGGITKDSYRVGWSLPDRICIGKSSIVRTLVTVIKSTEHGRYIPSPEDQDSVKNCAEVDDQISGLDLHTRTFRVPCVFTRSGFCLRRLTLFEIGAAMDLPVSSLPGLNISAQLVPQMVNYVCDMPPMKVLQTVADLCFKLYASSSVSVSPNTFDVWKPSFLYKDLEYEELQARDVKAAKADDAEANYDLWNIPATARPDNVDHPIIATGNYIPADHDPFYDGLRTVMLHYYRYSLRRSFMRYLRNTYSLSTLKEGSDINLLADLNRGADAISRANKASFWSWDDGSTLFFWRWQPEYILEARDGVPNYIYWDKIPNNLKPQSLQKDPLVLAHESSKLHKVVDRRYLCEGPIRNLTNYFSIPKGEGDIRMVYDATRSGLNDALWAPNFWLPTMDFVSNFVTSSTFFGDIDCGEMFLNFFLDPRIRPYAGVDLSNVYEGTRIWRRWERSGMGFCSSPYTAIRMMSVAKEVIKGNRLSPDNPFHWTIAVTNYPGRLDYNPALPYVYKFNPLTKTVANDISGFVDDFRGAGANYNECLRVMHHFAAEMQYMGIQDAPRKRRPVSQRPGAWTGSIILTIPKVGVFLKCMDAKWLKTKRILLYYKDVLAENDQPLVSFKKLEEDVGFLIHISLTYPVIKPYLRSFYASMNSWRPDRDNDGWKLRGRALRSFYQSMGVDYNNFPDSHIEAGSPEKVRLIQSFPLHLKALLMLFEGEVPALRLIRGEIVNDVDYGFGDASGKGFGASWAKPTSKHIGVRVGVWNKEGIDKSSNYKELRNTTETLEAKGDRGELEGVVLFFFTDNSVSESICHKGGTSSQVLFDLVLRIKALEMKYKCIVHIIHVAGTRMIAQGTDGISRGDMCEGVLNGDTMLQHVPLADSALDRAPLLKSWLLSWLGDLDLEIEFLDETGWFERGHDIIGGRMNCDNKWIPDYKTSILIWSPPPAGAAIAAQELRQARHKRTNSIHAFICPRLMTPEWEKHILRSADLILTIPVGQKYWPKDMHEPLKLALYFPYVRVNPWQLKRSVFMARMAGRLQSMWKNGEGTEGDLLSQLCQSTRRMADMPLRNLRNLLFGRSTDGLPLLLSGGGEQTSVEEEQI